MALKPGGAPVRLVVEGDMHETGKWLAKMRIGTGFLSDATKHYDQVTLDGRSSDLTAFMTDLGLLRLTRIPQGWANSVAVFMHVILWQLAPDYTHPDSQQLHVGDLVLVHDTRHANDRSRSRKLEFRWLGPYRVHEIAPDSTHYYLDELDGTQLKRSFAGNRLKRFFSRPALDDARREIFESIRVRTDFENMPEEEDNEEEDGGDGF